MEAALRGGDAPPPTTQLPQRHHSVGLPPRGPPTQRAISAALDAALTTAGGGMGVSREPSGSQPFSSAAGLLPVGRTSSSVSAPGLLEAVDAAAAAGEAAPAPVADAPSQAVPSQPAAAPAPAAQQPPWQSPARIAPVPPLPLSRLSSGGHGSARSGGGEAGGGPADELNLLPLASAAAPAGLLPPQPQPALLSRGWSGSAGQGRRPTGLAALDTEGLTFESFGLESPDTITPGLQYARQVAQLFVEGRRRSGTSGLPSVLGGGASTAGGCAADGASSAASSVAGGSSSASLAAGSAAPAAPSRLGQAGCRGSAAGHGGEGAEQAPGAPAAPLG